MKPHWVLYRTNCRDFLGGLVVKSLTSNVGNTGSIPGQRPGIPHVMVQLGPLSIGKDSACPNQDLTQPNKEIFFKK